MTSAKAAAPLTGNSCELQVGAQIVFLSVGAYANQTWTFGVIAGRSQTKVPLFHPVAVARTPLVRGPFGPRFKVEPVWSRRLGGGPCRIVEGRDRQKGQQLLLRAGERAPVPGAPILVGPYVEGGEYVETHLPS